MDNDGTHRRSQEHGPAEPVGSDLRSSLSDNSRSDAPDAAGRTPDAKTSRTQPATRGDGPSFHPAQFGQGAVRPQEELAFLGAPSYVYAIGRAEPRFPTMGLEKEFAQVAGREETANLTDRQALQSLLSEPHNRYLARKLCWAFTVEGVDTYVLQPSDIVDINLLIGTLRQAPRSTDIDVVVGVRGPIAPPEMCNGLMVPVVFYDQVYSFDVDSLVSAIPRPKGIKADDFGAAAEELFSRIQQMGDNEGATDADRALNYLSVRYPAIYHTAAEQFASDASLTSVETRPSRLSGARTIIDVIFSYTNRKTDVTDKHFVRVDVTEEFPFLVTKLAPYYDRIGD